ncbi:MAG TPA: cytochrome c [Bryobacteraceae bacterium]|nr:cytochrome c [Bryobacteraceae bacterium]
MKSVLGAIAGLAGMIILCGLHSPAQSPASVWDGVYTADQAKRGEGAYNEQCAPCHGEALEGNAQTERAQKLERVLPPLAGDVFQGNWNGRPLSDLFDKIRKTMPRDDQGKLTTAQTADILAFMLKFNQFPAGKEELPRDAGALTEIQFEAVKPK